MTDYFAAPKRRIARAHEHINDLDGEIERFLAGDPHVSVIEVDSQTGNKTHKIKLAKRLPDSLLDRADEIAEALRSALDKAGYAAAEAVDNTRLKSTYFPVADTEASLETDVIGRGKCRDLPPEILALFRGFEPYKARNPLIWAVNQLANGTKHRILVPVGMSTGGVFEASFDIKGLTVSLNLPPFWDTENDEMVLCVVGPDAQPQYKMRMRMFVEIRPIAGLNLGPAAAAFRAMASEVERVVLATEAETIRILAAKGKDGHATSPKSEVG